MRQPRRCYICAGTGTIEVHEWDPEDDEDRVSECVCVRCGGDGTLTDGFRVEDLRVPDERVLARSQVCICYYPEDGPLGHPGCPGR